MRIVFIGTVDFSYKILERLISINADVRGVVTRQESSFNADYRDILPLCIASGIPYIHVKNVNTEESMSWIRSHRPDIVFCFGWSQLLTNNVLKIAPMGVVGYHPAELPFNRGRHPLVWALALGLDRTASTFFFMDEGADTGDILSQRLIEIQQEDDAGTLYRKITNEAMEQIEIFLPSLETGTFKRITQDPNVGNSWRKRGIVDGKIDWRMNAYNIHNLVRALTKPYVGAHFEYKLNKYKVWETKIIKKAPANIEPGKIILATGSRPVVKCGEGAIQLLTVEPVPDLKMGEYL